MISHADKSTHHVRGNNRSVRRFEKALFMWHDRLVQRLKCIKLDIHLLQNQEANPHYQIFKGKLETPTHNVEVLSKEAVEVEAAIKHNDAIAAEYRTKQFADIAECEAWVKSHRVHVFDSRISRKVGLI